MASLAPELLLRIAWAHIDRDDMHSLELETTGFISEPDRERELEHRSRLSAMNLVNRHWHQSLREELYRRVYIDIEEDASYLLRSIEADGHLAGYIAVLILTHSHYLARMAQRSGEDIDEILGQCHRLVAFTDGVSKTHAFFTGERDNGRYYAGYDTHWTLPLSVREASIVDADHCIWPAVADQLAHLQFDRPLLDFRGPLSLRSLDIQFDTLAYADVRLPQALLRLRVRGYIPDFESAIPAGLRSLELDVPPYCHIHAALAELGTRPNLERLAIRLDQRTAGPTDLYIYGDAEAWSEVLRTGLPNLKRFVLYVRPNSEYSFWRISDHLQPILKQHKVELVILQEDPARCARSTV